MWVHRGRQGSARAGNDGGEHRIVAAIDAHSPIAESGIFADAAPFHFHSRPPLAFRSLPNPPPISNSPGWLDHLSTRAMHGPEVCSKFGVARRSKVDVCVWLFVHMQLHLEGSKRTSVIVDAGPPCWCPWPRTPTKRRQAIPPCHPPCYFARAARGPRPRPAAFRGRLLFSTAQQRRSQSQRWQHTDAAGPVPHVSSSRCAIPAAARQHLYMCISTPCGR